MLAIVVFGEGGLQYMDTSFQVYAKALIAAAFLIQLLALFYMMKHNYSIIELQVAPDRRVIKSVMLLGIVLPLLLLLQLQNSLALCLSIQDRLLPPSLRRDAWSFQLPMLGYTVAFSVLWVFVLNVFGTFYQRHSDNGKLNGAMPPQYILLGSLGLLAVFWLSSMATQYLWWKIYGIYNEVSSVSYITQLAGLLLALPVFAVLVASKLDKESSNTENIKTYE